MASSPSPKLVIVGIDGATFDLLDPLVAEGVMPNLGQLLAEGTRARLQSTIPPVTAPAWTTFTTGVNPGRHGVFDFRHRIGGKVHWVNSRSVRAPRIWDLANTAGQSAGVINVPLTYPPTPVQGYMLSGFLTPQNSREYTHPPELRRQLEEAIGEYVIYEPIPPLGLSRVEEIEAYLGRMRSAVAQRARALYWLMSTHPTHLVVIVFQVLDALQHTFWKFLDSREPAFDSELAVKVRPALLDCYRQIDDVLGEIRSRMDHTAHLILGSDHGFGPHNHLFLVNEWLAQQGFLSYSRRRLITEKLVRRVRNRLRVGEPSAPLIDQTTRFVPDHKSVIDWARTEAFSGEIHQQAIYVNLRGREPKGVVPLQEYETVRDKIIARVSELCDPISGKQIPCRVCRRDEIYSGPFVDRAPDLSVIVDDYNYQVTTHFSLRGRYLRHQPLPLGTHRCDGVVVICGPGVRAGHDLTSACISDVTPTALHLMGLPVPEGLDGNVLVEAMEPGWVEGHPVRYHPVTYPLHGADEAIYSESEAADIEARLRGLGYLE